PKNVPEVKWTVSNTVKSTIEGVAVITQELIAQVDANVGSAEEVNLRCSVTVPTELKAPAPIVMLFAAETDASIRARIQNSGRGRSNATQPAPASSPILAPGAALNDAVNPLRAFLPSKNNDLTGFGNTPGPPALQTTISVRVPVYQKELLKRG